MGQNVSICEIQMVDTWTSSILLSAVFYMLGTLWFIIEKKKKKDLPKPDMQSRVEDWESEAEASLGRWPTEAIEWPHFPKFLSPPGTKGHGGEQAVGGHGIEHEVLFLE